MKHEHQPLDGNTGTYRSRANWHRFCLVSSARISHASFCVASGPRPVYKCDWEEFGPRQWHAVMCSPVHNAWTEAPAIRPAHVDPPLGAKFAKSSYAASHSTAPFSTTEKDLAAPAIPQPENFHNSVNHQLIRFCLRTISRVIRDYLLLGIQYYLCDPRVAPPS